MRSTSWVRLSILCSIILILFAAVPAAQLRSDEPPAKPIPTLFIVGDSTVRNGQNNMVGWGERLAKLFDAAKIKIENRAIAGRSTRTFINEGRWDKILADAKPGDFVLVQMGHNDGGPVDTGPARGSLRGIGEETREITNAKSGQPEVIHTYGWYLRKYISDARSKDMTPILCSQIPHCPKAMVEAGAVEKINHVAWSKEVAEKEGCPFIDLNRLIMQKYVGMEPAEIKAKYFTPRDDGHTSAEGAELNAACVVEGLRLLKDCPLVGCLRTDQPEAGK